MRSLKNVLVSGGAGFIGSNFIRFMLEEAADFSGRIINLDALTYAGNPASLEDIEAKHGPASRGSGEYRTWVGRNYGER